MMWRAIQRVRARDEPAVLVRLHAPERIDELEKDRGLLGSGRGEAKLVDVHGRRARRGPHHRIGDRVCAEHLVARGDNGSLRCAPPHPRWACPPSSARRSVARTPVPSRLGAQHLVHGARAELGRGVGAVVGEDRAVGDRADRDRVTAADARASAGSIARSTR